MNKQKQAYIYTIIAVLFWSTMASAFKISLRFLNVLQFVFFTSIIAIIALSINLIIQRKLKLLKVLTLKDYLRSAILGFLNPFLYYIVLIKAYSLLKAQEAGVLNYTWPIVLVILSIPILKQKIGLKSIFAIIISFLGIIIISTQGNILALNFSNIKGVVLAVGSAFIWALFWIYNIKDKRDENCKILLNFIFGFLYIFITILVFSEFALPSINGIISVIYIGLFEMGITFVIWLKALKLSSTTAKVSNLIYLCPFISLFIIHFAVGEKILISTIFGLIFIVGGIILQQYSNRLH
ncbi:MAG: DMT family transporter [Bacteroidales bacterium]|nr:DMT family transporter [Bacteroidales bacterium]